MRWLTAHGWVVSFVTLGAVLVALLVNYIRDDNTREAIPREAQARVNEALYANCVNDRRFRIAYRERAKVERKLLRVETEANEALIDVTNEIQADGPTYPSIVALGEKLDSLNRELNDLRARVVILPLPQCQKLRHIGPHARIKPPRGGSNEPSPDKPSREKSGGGRSPSPPVDVGVDSDGDGSHSVPVGDPPPTVNPAPPPPEPDPPGPSPQPEEPRPPVDAPLIDECGLAPILCR